MTAPDEPENSDEHDLDASLLPQDFPGNVAPQLFTGDNLPAFTGGPLDLGAILGRDLALSVEPGPDAGSVGEAQNGSQGGLTAEHLRGAMQGLLLGGEVGVHAEVYAAHTSVVNASQTHVYARPYRARMEKHPKHRTDGLGPRLKAARTHAGLTQDKAAVELGVKKATISSWETSRNIPDALMLGKLAQLYRQTADALLWDESISLDAVQIAVQFDALSERQQRAFKAMWLAYFTEAATDDAVERSYGLPKRETSTPGGHDQED